MTVFTVKIVDCCFRNAHLTVRSNTRLTSETVKGLSLTLQGVDNVHGNDGLTTGVLSVGDRVTDDVLKEDLEDSTSP